jgi:hypothetical protein
MGLAYVFAALISAVGTLSGALGGIALTSGLEARRQQRRADGEAATERAAVRDQARADLLASITRLRVDIELACARHWRDMNVRLTAVQEQAVTTGVLATRIALLSPVQEAEAAFALGKCASRLAALTARSITLGDFDGPNKQFIAGDITGIRPDLSELDRLVTAFLSLISPRPATASTDVATSAAGKGARDRLSQPSQ